jgi:hypothetical protein
VLEHMRSLCLRFDHSLDPPPGNGFMVGSVPGHRAEGEPAKCPEPLIVDPKGRGSKEGFHSSWRGPAVENQHWKIGPSGPM